MYDCNHKISVQRSNQIFKFIIGGSSATRATVTIHAENLDAAWNYLHLMFPGTDLSDTEVQHAGHHSLSERAVHT